MTMMWPIIAPCLAPHARVGEGGGRCVKTYRQGGGDEAETLKHVVKKRMNAWTTTRHDLKKKSS